MKEFAFLKKNLVLCLLVNKKQEKKNRELVQRKREYKSVGVAPGL